MFTNGMSNLFPNYFDDKGFLFYPLQELTTLEEEFQINAADVTDSCMSLWNLCLKAGGMVTGFQGLQTITRSA